MTQPERPPIGWGRALKILVVVLALGLIACFVFLIVVAELMSHGHLGGW